MSSQAIDRIDFLPLPSVPDTGVAGAATAAPGFASWFGQALSDVNTRLTQADTSLRLLAAGDADNLHQVMMRMEEARLSFQLALQVRNRALEAYQDMLRMQI